MSVFTVTWSDTLGVYQFVATIGPPQLVLPDERVITLPRPAWRVLRHVLALLEAEDPTEPPVGSSAWPGADDAPPPGDPDEEPWRVERPGELPLRPPVGAAHRRDRERTDPERTGPERTDPERTGPERTDPERTDPDLTDPGSAEPPGAERTAPPGRAPPPRRGKAWSDEEEAIVREAWAVGEGAAAIGRSLGRTKGAVLARLVKLGLVEAATAGLRFPPKVPVGPGPRPEAAIPAPNPEAGPG